MANNTYVSVAAIAVGGIIIVAELITGSVDPIMTGIAGAAIGAGVGIPIGVTVQAAKAVEPSNEVKP